MKKFVLSILVLLFCFDFAFTQEKGKAEPYRKWEIGLNGGGATFTGEWNMSKDAFFNHFSQWNGHLDEIYGAILKRNFNNVFALELGWNHTNLTGSWKYDSRNIAEFRTQIIQSDLSSVWNLSNLFSTHKYDRNIYLYGKIGGGVSHLWRREGKYPLFHDNQWKLTIPVGAGVAIRLIDHVKLNVGTQWSWINTDRVDGMKTETLTTRTGNFETAVFGTKLYTYVGISYVFGKKRKPEKVTVPSKPQPQPEPKPEPRPEPKPVVKVKPVVVGNGYKIYFAFDKWNLNNQTMIDLDRLALDMKENPTVDVEIKSHTDSRGPSSYNMKLSEKRGKSVIDYLASKGVNISRINALALGETNLVNKCKDGVPCKKVEHALNRRTESIVIE
jgi:outer membrane protein OmpA-like peptidoglycan-associated protein